MYEERKEKFSFKSFFLTILLVLLFIFLMLWLFPTKSYIDNRLQGTNTVNDLERLSVLYDEIFANNVSRMKDAAIGYFTNERMPQTVGETKKLTLQEMYNLHLVLKMKDKNGSLCSPTKSYVEMTKYTEEYRLKVNLSCGTQEDYIIVYLGCYSYCPTGICEKKVSTPSATTAKEEKQQTSVGGSVENKYYCAVVDNKYYDKNGNIVSKSDYDKSCSSNSNYLYEYKLVTNGGTGCSNWSGWQKNYIASNGNTEVQTKTEREVTGYSVIDVPVTKTVTEKKQVTERYISKYVTQVVQTGTKDVQVGTTTKTVTEKVAVGSVEKATGRIGTGSVVPQNTSTIHYKVISTDTNTPCSYCTNKTMYTWEEYSVETVYDVVTKNVTVPVYKTINVYETKEVPVYDFRTVEKNEQVTKTVNEKRTVEDYRNVTYYRYRTCGIENSRTYTEWSTSKNDTSLTKKGYVYTGNYKKA